MRAFFDVWWGALFHVYDFGMRCSILPVLSSAKGWMMNRQEEVCFQWDVEAKNAMARLRNYVVERGQRLASAEKESTIEAV